MKSKILSMFLLTAILSLVMISAADLTFTQSIDSQTFTSVIEATNPEYTITLPVITDDDGNSIVFSETSNTTTKEVILTIDSIDYDELSIGSSYTGDLIVSNPNTTEEDETKTVEIMKTFCELGEQGDEDDDIGLLEIVDVNIDNNDGDDLEWSPLDSITIEIEVENIGDDKVRDIIVEIGLFDIDGKNIIDDMNELDKEEIELGSINDGDDDTAIFEFKVPADFDDDAYSLVIKAYSDDMDEDTVCTSKVTDFDESDYYESISGERETDEENHIAVDNIRLSPIDPQCGEIVQLSAEVFNIGDYDYEDQVRVTLFNQALGIEDEIIIREDFDQGDSESIDFEFKIAEDAEVGTYALELRTYYDYDDKDEYYNIESEKRFIKSFAIAGNCEVVPVASSVRITAKLSSDTPDAMAGEQVIITATLENIGDSTELYTISVSGNTAWSSLSEIDPESIIIPAGESKEVEIILDLDADAEGDKEFTIKATNDEVITKEQKVLLSITEASSGAGITGGAIMENIKANGFIYAIVLINLILIIAIILVIRRMVSPSSSI